MIGKTIQTDSFQTMYDCSMHVRDTYPDAWAAVMSPNTISGGFKCEAVSVRSSSAYGEPIKADQNFKTCFLKGWKIQFDDHLRLEVFHSCLRTEGIFEIKLKQNVQCHNRSSCQIYQFCVQWNSISVSAVILLFCLTHKTRRPLSSEIFSAPNCSPTT